MRLFAPLPLADTSSPAALSPVNLAESKSPLNTVCVRVRDVISLDIILRARTLAHAHAHTHNGHHVRCCFLESGLETRTMSEEFVLL